MKLIKNLKFKIKNCIAIILIFNYSVIVPAQAQRRSSSQPAHEFSIYGSGGLSALRSQLSQGSASGRLGGDLGVGYTIFFIDSWGIHTGIGLGFYGAKATLDGEKIITRNLKDSDGDLFDLHTTLTSYSETHNAMFLNVPVMVQFQAQQRVRVPL